MTPAEKTFTIVFVFGLLVFIYYFFVIPPTPVYYEHDPTNPPPANAQLDLETGQLIVGYERPSTVFVIPPVLFFYMIMIMATDGGEKRLKEIIDVKQKYRDLRHSFWMKIREGKDQYTEWKNK